MKLSAVIFDMDGLLIDSEPLWEEAAVELFQQYNIKIRHEEYITTTGLRSKEFVEWWFNYFNIKDQDLADAEKRLIRLVVNKIKEKCIPLPGVAHIFNFFYERNFKIGIASSSPMELIDLVAVYLGIDKFLHAKASAEKLPHGKPHPQVYMDCAQQLAVSPIECVCFEDSFNGLISAKAARMKCVVVPDHTHAKEDKWAAADLKLSSLQNFGDLHLSMIQGNR
jgi:mannitol-1-/sugar-/sorbitol-6-/2-deoxyglucose-6-phosphatase